MAEHRKLAVELFNLAWALMDAKQRSIEECDHMLRAAYASCYHWSQCGTVVNLARGEWQISRVYAILRRSEPSLFHAQRCLSYCEMVEKKTYLASTNNLLPQIEIGQLEEWDLPYAHEAFARAYAVGGQVEACQEQLELAQRLTQSVADPESKSMLEADLVTVLTFLVPHRAS